MELIRVNEINPFFLKVKSQVEKSKHFDNWGFKLHYSTKRMITWGNKTYFKDIPDYVDKKILAEAIFILREITKEKNCFLVSLDTHFSPAKKDSIVRDLINKEFGIYCDWPEPIFNKVKEMAKAGLAESS